MVRVPAAVSLFQAALSCGARRAFASRATGAGLGRAGPHDLVLALAHLYVSKSSTGCLRPSARPEGLSLISHGFSRNLSGY